MPENIGKIDFGNTPPKKQPVEVKAVFDNPDPPYFDACCRVIQSANPEKVKTRIRQLLKMSEDEATKWADNISFESADLATAVGNLVAKLPEISKLMTDVSTLLNPPKAPEPGFVEKWTNWLKGTQETKSEPDIQDKVNKIKANLTSTKHKIENLSNESKLLRSLIVKSIERTNRSQEAIAAISQVAKQESSLWDSRRVRFVAQVQLIEMSLLHLDNLDKKLEEHAEMSRQILTVTLPAMALAGK